MRTSVRLIVAVAALLAFFAVAQGWERGAGVAGTGEPGLRGAAAGLGLLLLGSYLFGLLAKSAHLPKLSGYLLFGMLVGPSALRLVSSGQLEYLKLVNDLAIAVIALTAGGEIDLGGIRSRAAAVLGVAFSVSVCVGAGVFVVAATWPGLFGFEPGGWSAGAVAVAAMVATLAIANSPAVLVAMMTETGSRGPMPQTALAATVIKDLVLITLFAVVFAWAGPRLGAESSHGGVVALLVKDIGGSVVFGALAGLGMAWYLHKIGTNLPVFVVLSGFLISLVSEELGFEPLLAALVAGLMMRNIWAEEAEPLFEAIEQLSLPVYCVFFAVAGAKLELGRVPEVGLAALVLVGVRAVFTCLGVRVGVVLGRLDAASSRRLWTAFLPQAGVVLVLASIVDQALAGQDVGERFFLVVVMAMGIHEIVGPVLLRWGLSSTPGADPEPVADEG